MELLAPLSWEGFKEAPLCLPLPPRDRTAASGAFALGLTIDFWSSPWQRDFSFCRIAHCGEDKGHTDHSLTQPATHSFIHPFILSFIYLFIYFIFTFNHLFTGPLVCLLSHSFNKQTLVRRSLERWITKQCIPGRHPSGSGVQVGLRG